MNLVSCYFFVLTLTDTLSNGRKINLLPIGIAQESKTVCVLGNGVVISPHRMLRDFDALDSANLDYKNKLLISQR